MNFAFGPRGDMVLFMWYVPTVIVCGHLWTEVHTETYAAWPRQQQAPGRATCTCSTDTTSPSSTCSESNGLRTQQFAHTMSHTPAINRHIQ